MINTIKRCRFLTTRMPAYHHFRNASSRVHALLSTMLVSNTTENIPNTKNIKLKYATLCGIFFNSTTLSPTFNSLSQAEHTPSRFYNTYQCITLFAHSTPNNERKLIHKRMASYVSNRLGEERDPLSSITSCIGSHNMRLSKAEIP